MLWVPNMSSVNKVLLEKVFIRAVLFRVWSNLNINYSDVWGRFDLTHWGRVTHICVSKLTTIGSDNGLAPGRRQAIIQTNAGMLLIGPLGTNFSEILSEIHTFSFKKMHLKLSSAKLRPFGFGLNVLIYAISQSSIRFGIYK